MDEKVLEALSRKLDIIIGLLLKAGSQKQTERENIFALKNAGLTVEEIGRALGKTPNSVYLVLSRARRRGKPE